jgi:hypothetical protein
MLSAAKTRRRLACQHPVARSSSELAPGGHRLTHGQRLSSVWGSRPDHASSLVIATQRRLDGGLPPQAMASGHPSSLPPPPPLLHRLVLADLIGRWFNCLWTDHMVVVCPNAAHCLRFHREGHQAHPCKHLGRWIPPAIPSGRIRLSSSTPTLGT